VADLAPLIGENRALVSRGLVKLNQAQRPGIAAMLQEAQLEQGQISAGTVGFVLGPRLNAAGRLDDAMVSYKLLTTSCKEEATALAQQLGAQNRERQRLMHEMVAHARDQVQKLGDDKVYVLADRSYQAGIAGLVASRIQEEFYRPALVIALEDDQSKGSARSINGFHITRALKQCGRLLVKYGGHSAAAGFTIRNEDIEAFRDRLRDIAARELSEEDLTQVVKVDAALPLTLANGETLAQVEMLQPFGVGNPRPTFLSQDVQVRACYAVGSAGTSLKFKLSDGLAVWDAIAFRQAVPAEQVPARLDVLYTLQTRTWNGRERLQLVVKDWRPAEA
jgi:single-stranded-DNA-specific exonuclease